MLFTLSHKTRIVLRCILLACLVWTGLLVVVSAVLSIMNYPQPLPSVYQGMVSEPVVYYRFGQQWLMTIQYFLQLAVFFPIVLLAIFVRHRDFIVLFLLFVWPPVFIPLVAYGLWRRAARASSS